MDRTLAAAGTTSASAIPVFAERIFDGTEGGKAQKGKNHDTHGNGSYVVCYHIHIVPR